MTLAGGLSDRLAIMLVRLCLVELHLLINIGEKQRTID